MRIMISLMDKGPQAWRDLSYGWRMDVIYYARQGLTYPDLRIAAVAVDWAKWLLGMPLLLFSLLPGTISWAHGVALFLRVALGLAGFIFLLGVLPWLDAHRIARVNGPMIESIQEAAHNE